MSTNLAGLWRSGSNNWRHFALAWAFPVFLYLAFIALSLHGPTRSSDLLPFNFVLLGVLVLSGIFGFVPYRRRKVSMGQTLFWIVLVPLIAFFLLALLPLRFPITIKEIPTGPGAR